MIHDKFLLQALKFIPGNITFIKECIASCLLLCLIRSTSISIMHLKIFYDFNDHKLYQERIFCNFFDTIQFEAGVYASSCIIQWPLLGRGIALAEHKAQRLFVQQGDAISRLRLCWVQRQTKSRITGTVAIQFHILTLTAFCISPRGKRTVERSDTLHNWNKKHPSEVYSMKPIYKIRARRSFGVKAWYSNLLPLQLLEEK